MANNNLNAARKAKNDEFYTMLEDIEAEVSRYNEQFQDKVVYTNLMRKPTRLRVG